ncbi:MAG: protease modulator HflC [Burkholderiales bacterium]|jgi:membrane protease subunit HflC|nr:protease modulator HflC [Nitrosomonadaceae bacterium]
MKQQMPLVVIAVIAIILAILASVFTVDQRQATIRFRFGEVIALHTDPGLYFKVPMIDQLRTYDKRIQTLDSRDAERVQTSEKNNVLVDSFVKYRIIDFKQFFEATTGDIGRAEIRLSQTINDDMRSEFSRRTLAEVISGERDKIMESLRTKADKDARNIGIEVLDVRLKRVDLVQEISADVYKRMESERKRVANELRATGAGEADKIKADAERQRTIILAEAYREAQKTKGEGDAQAARIYAQAFGRNAEFYSFYRSMEAYRESFRNRSDVLVLEPNSEFFKYLRNPNRGGR